MLCCAVVQAMRHLLKHTYLCFFPPCAAHLLRVIDPTTGQLLHPNKLKAEVAAFMAAGEDQHLLEGCCCAADPAQRYQSSTMQCQLVSLLLLCLLYSHYTQCAV